MSLKEAENVVRLTTLRIWRRLLQTSREQPSLTHEDTIIEYHSKTGLKAPASTLANQDMSTIVVGEPSTNGVPTSGGHGGLNTLRAVLDYAPGEIAELEEEIRVLEDKIQKRQIQETYLKRLLEVATEYYDKQEKRTVDA